MKLYMDISNSFKLLHSKQLQMNAETTRPMTEYFNSRYAGESNKRSHMSHRVTKSMTKTDYGIRIST